MLDILLATFNSERYLREQLNSILSQSYQDFNIIISDDGSTDNTLNIINEYIAKNGSKITLLPDVYNRSAKQNFNYLLQHSNADYIAFADHDDIWLVDKLKLSIDELKNLEGKDRFPALVFTDKSIVDAKLNIIATSSTKAELFECFDIKLNSLLVQNIASGCTMMFNKPMKKIIGSIPAEATMHDNYIIILAKIFGSIKYIDKPLLLYRQHEDNELGAKKYGVWYLLKKFINERKFLNEKFMRQVSQALKILELYSEQMSRNDRETLKHFSELKSAGFFKFKYILIRYNFLKTGLLRKLGMIILLSKL